MSTQPSFGAIAAKAARREPGYEESIQVMWTIHEKQRFLWEEQTRGGSVIESGLGLRRALVWRDAGSKQRAGNLGSRGWARLRKGHVCCRSPREVRVYFKLHDAGLTGERLRALRAVEVLKYVAALQKVADGVPATRLTSPGKGAFCSRRRWPSGAVALPLRRGASDGLDVGARTRPPGTAAAPPRTLLVSFSF